MRGYVLGFPMLQVLLQRLHIAEINDRYKELETLHK